MAITLKDFDDLGLEVVKQKYYNANKVNAKLEELKAGVAELLEENELLKDTSGGNDELAAAAESLVKSAEQIAQNKILEAQQKADKIIAEAKAQAEKITSEAQQNGAGSGGGFTEAQLDLIDDLNRQLDSLSTSQSTQIFKLKQQLMKLVID